MFELEPHGPDTFVGTGPQYPWGGLYGGQIIAQALRAAALTVDASSLPHSIRAYFIRPGDHDEPVRYEVDRIRNGRSFTTRRVVARQAIGAILNAECSFQKPELSPMLQSIEAPIIGDVEQLENSSFSPHFERRFVDLSATDHTHRDGTGRVVAWMRVTHDLSQMRQVEGQPFLDESWLAYLSDDLATDAVRAAIREGLGEPEADLHSISLDHTIWFHRPLAADDWHLHDFSCHHVAGGRGLTIGHVFDRHGGHTATVAQEVLVRTPRS